MMIFHLTSGFTRRWSALFQVRFSKCEQDDDNDDGDDDGFEM